EQDINIVMFSLIEHVVYMAGIHFVKFAVELWLQSLPLDGETYRGNAFFRPTIEIGIWREEIVRAFLARQFAAGELGARYVEANQGDWPAGVNVPSALFLISRRADRLLGVSAVIPDNRVSRLVRLLFGLFDFGIVKFGFA